MRFSRVLASSYREYDVNGQPISWFKHGLRLCRVFADLPSGCTVIYHDTFGGMEQGVPFGRLVPYHVDEIGKV